MGQMGVFGRVVKNNVFMEGGWLVQRGKQGGPLLPPNRTM